MDPPSEETGEDQESAEVPIRKSRAFWQRAFSSDPRQRPGPAYRQQAHGEKDLAARFSCI